VECTAGGRLEVICGIEVRSRHGNLEMYRPDIEMLAVGRDSEFEGLRGL
jgi:hypothetical protein